MCIYLQWNRNVPHLYLSPFTYSLGTCSLQFSCLACIYGLHAAFLLKMTQTPKSKAGRSERKAFCHLLGRWNVSLKYRALLHAALLHEKQRKHTHTHDSSFSVRSFIARYGILQPGPALPYANRSHSSQWLEQERTHTALHAICFTFM